MSVSRHPIALRLQRRVADPTRLLATVMGLPLVDGIFPALIVAGALDSPVGVLETGLLVFGGSATVAIVLAEMDEPRAAVPAICLLGVGLVVLASLEAVVAPTLRSVLAFDVFRRFAGVVILAVAARTASARVGEYLPRPAVVVGLGVVASLRPGGLVLAVTTDPALVGRAAAAAAVGVGFALALAVLGPQLRGSVDLDRFRFGSAVALGTLGLSVLGLVPTEAPVALGVLCVAAIFSFDPGGTDEATDGEADVAAVDEVADTVDDSAHPAEADLPRATVAGSDPRIGFETADDAGDDGWTGYPVEPGRDDDDARAPWL